MSVIFTPRARSSRWKALWPLALLLAVSIIGGIWMWRAWPQVLMQSAAFAKPGTQPAAAGGGGEPGGGRAVAAGV